MSDRIAVFNEGRIEQVSPPFELYEQPSTEFVAGFVGVSNVLERDGSRFTIRPEKVQLLEAGAARRGPAHRAGAGFRRLLRGDGDPVHGEPRARRRPSADSSEHRERGGGRRLAGQRGCRGLAPGARGRRPREIHKRGGIIVRKDAHPARTAWIVIAGLLAFMLLFAAGCGSSSDDSSERRRRTAEARQGRGPGQPDLLGRLRRTRLDEAVRSRRPAARSTTRSPEPPTKWSQLMRTGEYDGVSASGNATARLFEGGDVDPVNVDLVPNYKTVFSDLKDQPYNTFDGKPLRNPPRARGKPADVEQRRREARSEVLERDHRPEGRRPNTRARSATTTIRSTSPKRPST